MTSTIHFTNPGEIDLFLITTLGVNVKDEDSSPIGYFGTGLKYAIATCLRLGCSITIFSGGRRMEFTSRPVIARGKEFGQIVLHADGAPPQPLGFTTELGKNWEPWMAFRELYSNALDEGGECGVGALFPQAGATTILVTGEPMIEAYRRRGEWFLATGTALFPSINCEVSRRPTNFLYYKRVRVATLPFPALFTYNLQGSHRLTEDRTLGYHELHKPLAVALGEECEDVGLLEQILIAPTSAMESGIDFDWTYSPSKTFIDTVLRLNKTHHATLNQSAYAKVARGLPDQEWESIELSTVERKQLAKALGFLAENGYEVKEPIVFVESLGNHWVAGLAKKGKIFIPRTTFGKGTKFLTSTLLEEHLHLSRGLDDCSRDMQDWLFDKVVSLMEEKKGEPL